MKVITDLVYNITCYGCGLCATVCPKKVLDIRLNDDGFYVPVLCDKNSCLKCGLCIKVCSFVDKKLPLFCKPIESYGAWSTDCAVRKKCSSGGVAFEVGRYLLNEGYKVCSVRYNPHENRAEHYIASTKEELVQGTGSKYIQSFTLGGFRQVDRKQKYLIIGTPCQIDSFRKYVKLNHNEDNFIFIDFFCHGIPSKLVWNKYIDDAKKKVGNITYASWRNKFNYGWHDSWLIGIDGVNSSNTVNWRDSYNLIIREKKTFIQSRFSQGDIFYRMFLEHHCMSNACHKDCKYKKYNSSADIRVGDFWGKTYSKDEEGVSSVLCFTIKGAEILKRSAVCLVPHDAETVCEGQQNSCAKPSFLRPLFMKVLKNKRYSINDIKILLAAYKMLKLPVRVMNKIKYMLR